MANVEYFASKANAETVKDQTIQICDSCPLNSKCRPIRAIELLRDEKRIVRVSGNLAGSDGCPLPIGFIV